MQNTAFSLLDRKRKEVATIEHDSSIHQVYGEKKEGADYAYENTYSSYGFSSLLPGILDGLGVHFKHLRLSPLTLILG